MNKIEIVGEVGINHNGDMSIAKQMIDLAVKNELDYVKFQKRDVLLCYTKEELDKPRESPWGKTTYEQKMGLEFNLDEYKEIDTYCKSKNIKWFASPWDLKSVDFLVNNFPDIPYIKIASAMVTDLELLDYIDSKNIRTILSVGMSTKEEVETALDVLGMTCDTIMHTTSSYPTPLEELNLLKIQTLRDEYGKDYKIGYSNHFKSPMACIFAATLGIDMLEYHFTLDRSMYGSDQPASLEEPAMRLISDWINDIPNALGNGTWIVQSSEIPVMKKLRRWTKLS